MKKWLLPFLLLIVSLCRAQEPTLWGMTSQGGAYGGGVIFKYNLQTDQYTVEHNFKKDTSDGYNPNGSLILATDGTLYGMTQYGGSNNSYGALISYNIYTGEETVKHSFDDTHGSNPNGSLIQANNGLLYGMTQNGGATGLGTIFSYDIHTDSFTVIHDFGIDSDGQNPYGSLIQASNALLYGMTSLGGVYSSGMTFSCDIVSGTYTDIHDFGADTDGFNPVSSLTEVDDSLLYGMTMNGSTYGAGLIFRYSIWANAYTIVHVFSGVPYDGVHPQGALLKASNGLLYGMTNQGGSNLVISCNAEYNPGTIFSLSTTTGNDTVLHNFGNSPDGQLPVGSLIQASNGFLYGMTEFGGFSNCGLGTICIFDTLTGQERILYEFGSVSGDQPLGDLIEIEDSSILGFQCIPFHPQLQISPNPTTGQFTVHLPNNQGSYPAEVYSALGQKIEQVILTKTQNTINLSNQPTGMYFVYLQTDAGVITGKVVVAR